VPPPGNATVLALAQASHIASEGDPSTGTHSVNESWSAVGDGVAVARAVGYTGGNASAELKTRHERIMTRSIPLLGRM
jgi:hypothetical protein